MKFDLDASIPILRRTPAVLNGWLRDLPDEWVRSNEGPDTWSAFDVVGHLIHGDRTDWVPRVRHLLEHGEAVTFPPFDQRGHYEPSKGKSLNELLDTFATERARCLDDLVSLHLTPADFGRFGKHPEFGRVTLGQLLATWVAHDFNHLAQIARVMGRQYSDAVGPWRRYLKIIGEA